MTDMYADELLGIEVEGSANKAIYDSFAQTKLCKQCGQTKPLTAFYRSGKTYQAQCRECQRRDRRVTQLYLEHLMLPVKEWPPELLDAAKTLKAEADTGGKMDYAGSQIPAILDRYNSYLQFQQSPEDLEAAKDVVSKSGVKEIVAQLLIDVQAMKKQIADLQKQNEAPFNDQLNKIQAIQERKNLMQKIADDKSLEEIFGPEEHAEIVESLQQCIRDIDTIGYIDPYHLRGFTMLFEEHQTPMTDDILIVYRKHLMSGIEAARKREDYDSIKHAMISILPFNYYELDWSGIPYSAD